MNKFLIVLLLTTISAGSFAQTEKDSYPKTITVSGSAEMELIPDEIYVQVDLKEYEKRGQSKVTIDKIRQEFLASARSIGIPDSAITIAGYDGYNGNPWTWKKSKKDELLSSISYQLKLKTSKQMDDLVNILDDNATQNFFITRTSHSRITELRKQLKIQAIKAAKEKAIYLTAAIDEKIGTAITITEPVESYVIPYRNAFANTMMRDEEKQEETDVDFRKIKLKFDVNVVFELK